jgi:hypothetical protein
MRQRGVEDVQALLPEFVGATQKYARPPTSRFYVGAAALGSTGRVGTALPGVGTLGGVRLVTWTYRHTGCHQPVL